MSGDDVNDLLGAGSPLPHHSLTVERLHYEDRLRLRVGYAEMIIGTLLDDPDEAARNRQTWTSASQARRTRYRQQQEWSAQHTIPEGVQGEQE